METAKPALSFSSNALKVIAIAAMTIDHIAWAFVPTASVLGQVLHFVGRLTAPIMCWSIAQGYVHTRSFRAYLLRLAGFAVLSQIPFSLFLTMGPFGHQLNVLYTLCLGLLAIRVQDKVADRGLRVLLTVLILVLSLAGDWAYYGVAMCLIFYTFRDRPAGRNRAMVLLAALMVLDMGLGPVLVDGRDLGRALFSSVMHLGVLGSLFFISRASGEKGRPLPGGRWFFYAYYPAHLLVLYFLQLWLL